MKHDVFISYSSHDKVIADALCSKLENNHIRCWIAPRDILGGVEYGAAIIEALDGCQVVLLVFSARANDSPQVRKEVERAVSKGKILIPFRIEDILPTKAMEFAMSNTHWLDAMTPPLESHIEILTNTIHRLLNMDQPVAQSPITSPLLPPAPEQPLRSIPEITGILIKDSSGTETNLTEFGIVYNPYEEKILAASVRDYLIIERGSAIQKIPWILIDRVELYNPDAAKITLRTAKSMDPVKLRSGRVVGNDEFGFAIVLDLMDIRTITVMRNAAIS